MSRFRDAGYWYWIAMALALVAEAARVAFATPIAVLLGIALCLRYWAWQGSIGSMAVQVRLVYAGLLVAGLWPPLRGLHCAQLAGTLVLLGFDYCILARTLSLAPWNRRVPLTARLVWRTFASPPTRGRFALPS